MKRNARHFLVRMSYIDRGMGGPVTREVADALRAHPYCGVKVEALPMHAMEAATRAKREGPQYDAWLHGVCVALQVIYSGGHETTWCELVRAVGPAHIINYARHAQPEEWELDGFAAWAEGNFPEECK